MKVYRNLSEYRPEEKAVVTVGTFDGVHIGHQKLLKAIKQLADEVSGTSVLLTFHPHPRLVLFPEDNELRMLTTLDERIALLDEAGLQHLIVQPFSVDFSRTTALEYVRDILVKRIGVHKLVIGYDHHFGRNREGSLENLKDMAPNFGFEVQEIPAQEIDAVNISSTKIRNALEKGDIAQANSFLGYAYGLSGMVVEGKSLGRTIDFPTANLKPTGRHKLIPSNGVYATRVILKGAAYGAMTNIGIRPTISNSKKKVVESHIFDFHGDIYGEDVRVIFLKKMRDEHKFKDVSQLKNQLKQDAELARHYLATVPANS